MFRHQAGLADAKTQQIAGAKQAELEEELLFEGVVGRLADGQAVVSGDVGPQTALRSQALAKINLCLLVLGVLEPLGRVLRRIAEG